MAIISVKSKRYAHALEQDKTKHFPMHWNGKCYTLQMNIMHKVNKLTIYVAVML